MNDVKARGRMSSTAIEAALRCINVEPWKALKDEIDNYNPHVIILIARRMPRIFEILTEGNIWGFPNALVVSNFAIPWLANVITPETHVAIVDDTICQGTTLASACRKVCSFGAKPRVFAVGIKKATDLGELHTRLKIKPACIEKFSDEQYQEFSHDTARAMSFLPKAYESEFPIFSVDYANANVCLHELMYQFGRSRLKKFRAHNTSAVGTMQEELGRISLDVYPKQQCNYKIRIYLDDKARKGVVVPMATGYIQDFSTITTSKAAYDACQQRLSNTLEKFEPFADPELPPLETFIGETKFRLEQFISSLEFGLAHTKDLENFFDLASAKMSMHDTQMLFGEAVAKKFENISLQEHTRTEAPLDSSKGKNSPVLSDKMSELFKERDFESAVSSARTKTYEGIFIEFFHTLSMLTKAEDANAAPLEGEVAPSREAIKKNPALRLCIGPTFNDMCIIFQELWKNVANVPRDFPMHKVRSLLSEMLDRHIDLGGVVPVIAINGDRVYRKGEAPSYDSNVFLAYKVWHEESPEESSKFPLNTPWNLEVDDLPQEYQEALKLIDKDM